MNGRMRIGGAGASALVGGKRSKMTPWVAAGKPRVICRLMRAAG
jgi:hypothetical protein